MSANEIHKGDVGTVITVTLKDSDTSVDLSAASARYFLLRQPGGSITTITATLVGSGTSGVINFTSSASHFDTTGVYKLQVYIANSTTVTNWRSDIYEFFVYPNLDL